MKTTKRLFIGIVFGLLLVVFLGCPMNEAQLPTNIVYVDGTSDGDGTSWATAMDDVQQAIEYAATKASVSTPWQVWIKAGTYKPSGHPNIDQADTNNNVEKHFSLRSNVAVYGGFSGNETKKEQRNLDANTTILSGALDSGNVYHVLYHPQTVSIENASLYDVTITGGNASGSTVAQQNGGALYSIDQQTEFVNCIFDDNSAYSDGASCKGGAVYVGIDDYVFSSSDQYSTKFDSCMFSHNEANIGGAVYVSEAAGVKFDSCLFEANTSDIGGNALAVDLVRSNNDVVTNDWLIISGCGFLNNDNRTGTSAERNSSGGGAIAVYGSKIMIDYSTIWNNSTAHDGGAISLYNVTEGATVSAGKVVIANSLLSHNTAGDFGGALLLTKIRRISISTTLRLPTMTVSVVTMPSTSRPRLGQPCPTCSSQEIQIR